MAEGIKFDVTGPSPTSCEKTLWVEIDTRIVPTAAVTKTLYWLGGLLRLDTSREGVDPNLMTLTAVIAAAQTIEISSLVERTLLDFAIRDRIGLETRDLRNQIVCAALDPLHVAR